MCIIIYSFRVLHISVSWWSFTGIWVIVSLLKSPGPFSVFWPSSIIIIMGGFYINVSRWFFTGVWVTASLLKSPRPFSVFWPSSIIIIMGGFYINVSRWFFHWSLSDSKSPQVSQTRLIIIIIIIVIIIIILLWELIKTALADDLPLKFEWQQVSSSIQDTSQYSGRS